MKWKLGFIGCGNMARAMMGGVLGAGLLKPAQVCASNRSAAALQEASEKLKICTVQSNLEAASNCEVLVLSVKPQQYPAVIAEIADAVPDETVIVTIAPGFTLNRLEELFGKKRKLVRTMPNTPALVREGMTAVCPGEAVTPEELENVRRLLDAFGRSEVVGENMMDAVVAVSGSSPAYVYMMIEAMADAAVMGGMPRAKAYAFAAQAVYGSAKMVLETGLHPGALKDMVCSPAGTTIEAVGVLEKEGFRSSVIEAMRACMNKSKSM